MSRVFVYEWCCANAARGNDPRAASLFREGWAMLSAALEDFCRVPGVEVTTVLSPAMREMVSASEGVPPVIDRGLRTIWTYDEAAGFRAAAGEAEFALVIAPEFDDVLETRCRWAVEAGATLLGPSLKAIALTADKLELARHFQRQGVQTPETFRLHDVDLPRFPVPFVVKRRNGAGSDEMLVCTDIGTRANVDYEACGLGEMIVQPLLVGTPASVSFLIGERRAHVMGPTEQLASMPGNFRYLGGRAPLPEPLAQRALRIARSAVDCVPGLSGYVGVDVVLGGADDGSRDYAIEINPRLTTSYLGLRALCEDNLMEMLLRLVRGESVPKPHWRSGGVSWTPEGQIQAFSASTDIAPA